MFMIEYFYNENFIIRCNVKNNFISFYFKSFNGMYFYRFHIYTPIVFNSNYFFFVNGLNKCSYKINKAFKLMQRYFVNGIYNSFGCLNVIGLGYKNFILGDKLFVLLGDCNYVVLGIPCGLKVFCRKRHIYVLCSDRQLVGSFMSYLRCLKDVNFYKGKGVIEFQNFKFAKLKVGKKQRFM